jgi:hypothetical protein
MKTLRVNKLKVSSSFPKLDEISARLDALKEKHPIDEINWSNFSYKPDVKFSISYTDNEILLKYYITEEHFKAKKTKTNQMVCEDSCVEFFVSPADDGIYYNIEFNGIGTCLLGSGTKRENNIKADPGIITGIRRMTSLGNDPINEKEGETSWTITVAIPKELFFHHKIKKLEGKTFRANFYKCGDKLSVPHYVTWNPVGTSIPDFHQPLFFGKLEFI